MLTIKRTRSRRFPVLLRSDREDAGPYYLVDLAGFGVSWRKPGVERVPGEPSTSPMHGDAYSRRTTWAPTFRRAELAFALLELDDATTPAIAKRVADAAWERLGNAADPAQAERFALHLLARDAERASLA